MMIGQKREERDEVKIMQLEIPVFFTFHFINRNNFFLAALSRQLLCERWKNEKNEKWFVRFMAN